MKKWFLFVWGWIYFGCSPTIDSLEPRHVRPNGILTIYGSGLDEGSVTVARFNTSGGVRDKKLELVSGSDNQLKVVVPWGTYDGALTVKTSWGSASERLELDVSEDVGRFDEWTDITTFEEYYCVLNTVGTLFCFRGQSTAPFGRNADGSLRFVKVGQDNSWASLAPWASCGIHKDGSAACWTIEQGIVRVTNLPSGDWSFVDWRAGSQYCLIDRGTRKVMCGRPGGQPRLIPSVSGAESIIVDDRNACAFTTDKKFQCWGEGIDPASAAFTKQWESLLGKAPLAPCTPTDCSSGPNPIFFLDRTQGVVATALDVLTQATVAFPREDYDDEVVKAYSFGSCVLTNQEHVWCESGSSYLAGSTNPSPGFVGRLLFADGAVAIALTSFDACAVRKDHSLVCWDGNYATGEQ